MCKCANVFATRSRFSEFSSLETSFVYGILSTRGKCMRAMFYRDLDRSGLGNFVLRPDWHGLDDVLRIFFWPEVLNSHLFRFTPPAFA